MKLAIWTQERFGILGSVVFLEKRASKAAMAEAKERKRNKEDDAKVKGKGDV